MNPIRFLRLFGKIIGGGAPFVAGLVLGDHLSRDLDYPERNANKSNAAVALPLAFGLFVLFVGADTRKRKQTFLALYGSGVGSVYLFLIGVWAGYPDGFMEHEIAERRLFRQKT